MPIVKSETHPLFPVRAPRALLGVLLVFALVNPALGADGGSKAPGAKSRRSALKQSAGDARVEAVASVTNAPPRFAPLASDHPLAPVWNDPEFAKRLEGSYGFLSEAEPRMTAEEQVAYRDKVVPLLRDDPRKAIVPLEALAKLNASAVFDFTLGNIYFQSEDYTNAVRHFEAALGKFPDYRRAQRNLAFALMRDGKYKEAIQPLARTVALGGADSKVYGLLGFAYVNENRFSSAEGAYQQAVALEPDNIDFKLGLVRCSVATASYDRALALLDELTSQYPERASLWTLQASVFIQKDQPAKAAVSLEILRRRGGATAANLFLLGDLYLTQEARDLALEVYLEALQKDGGANIARGLRPAQVLLSRGAFDEARKLLAGIRASVPTMAGPDELKLLRLEARVALGSGMGETAIGILEKILQRDPLDGEALLLAGDYYAKSDSPEKAEFRYDAASKLSGFEADAFVKRAQLLVRTQKYAQAAEFLRKAQKSKPRENVQHYLDKVEQMAKAGRS